METEAHSKEVVYWIHAGLVRLETQGSQLLSRVLSTLTIFIFIFKALNFLYD